MLRSPLPLVALMGAMGCTQDASAPGEAPDDDGQLLQRLKGEDTPKGSSVRALSPEERASLFPRPLPVPEGWDASVEPEDAGSSSPDYAEQRRQIYEQRMQQLQEDAALRDAGIERTLEERAADEALVMGPVPKDIAGQRRQQLAKERLETGRFRQFGKGGGMKRSEIIHVIRDTDGGTQAAVKE
ncbi:hypothetical protein [Archangium gephyra]|uniref:Lipoprotein n=2 Tax=Archangium gephyra TaxID=48 RepID=A0AAC8Q3J3_9BACT|nr:hypothetical protein [Archangium gephyra]AKJ00329.1 Hypothetical protein AA314_01955 [Archangium gephyra]